MFRDHFPQFLGNLPLPPISPHSHSREAALLPPALSFSEVRPHLTAHTTQDPSFGSGKRTKKHKTSRSLGQRKGSTHRKHPAALPAGFTVPQFPSNPSWGCMQWKHSIHTNLHGENQGQSTQSLIEPWVGTMRGDSRITKM